MGRHKKPVDRTREFEVPLELTLRGKVVVSATTEDEAFQLVNKTGRADDGFYSTAEVVNWETGNPKEVK